jgi:hypothetical protein
MVFFFDGRGQTRTYLRTSVVHSRIFGAELSLSFRYLQHGPVYDMLNRIWFITCKISVSLHDTTSHSPRYSGPSFLQGIVIRVRILGRSIVITLLG